MIQSGNEGYRNIKIDEANDTISFQEPGSEKKTDLKIRDFVSSVGLNATTSNQLLNDMSFQQLKEIQNIAERKFHINVSSGIITKIDGEATKAAKEYLAKPEILRTFRQVFHREPDEKIIDRLSNLIKDGDVLPQNDPLNIAEIKLKSLLLDVAHLDPKDVEDPIQNFLRSPHLHKALKSERREIALELLKRLQSDLSAAVIRPESDKYGWFEASKIFVQMKLEVLCSYIDNLPVDELASLLESLSIWNLPIDQLKVVIPPEKGLKALYNLISDLRHKQCSSIEFRFLGDIGLSYAEYQQMQRDILGGREGSELVKQASCFVVRQKEFIETYRYSPDQIEYGIEMGFAVKLGQRLVNEKGIGGKELLQFLAGRRQHIAQIQNTKDAGDFGNYRQANGFTPCLGPYYARIAQELRWTRGEDFIESSKMKDYEDCYNGLPMQSPFQKKDLRFFEIKGRLPEADEDTTMNVLGADFDVEPEKYTLKEKPSAGIIHLKLEPAELNQVLDHVADLFDEAIRPETSVEVAKEKLIRAFWWICQAKPWVRGDPSIAEMFMKTGFALKGISLRPWKEGAIPWVEVMLKGEEDFVASFKELLG